MNIRGDWKCRTGIKRTVNFAGVENAGLELKGPMHRGGIKRNHGCLYTDAVLARHVPQPRRTHRRIAICCWCQWWRRRRHRRRTCRTRTRLQLCDVHISSRWGRLEFHTAIRHQCCWTLWRVSHRSTLGRRSGAATRGSAATVLTLLPRWTAVAMCLYCCIIVF